MADAAAARREARRRRILENSHNRLQLISGKLNEESSKDSLIINTNPDHSNDIPISTEHTSCSKNSLNNGVVISEPESYELLSPNHDIAAGDGEASNDLASLASTVSEPAPKQTLLEKLINYKYDIVLLSLVIQFLYSLSLITVDDTYLFLPVLIYVITKLIYFPSQNNSKIGNALQLVQVMSSHRVRKMIGLTQFIGVISCDICIFLFTTICIQSLLITLKNELIT